MRFPVCPDRYLCESVCICGSNSVFRSTCALCTAISEHDVFLRASFPLRFPRGSKFGILQKVTKETKSCGFYPGPSFPSLPSVKSERMYGFGCGSAALGNLRSKIFSSFVLIAAALLCDLDPSLCALCVSTSLPCLRLRENGLRKSRGVAHVRLIASDLAGRW
jgi:hypothetical protein